MSDLNSLFSRFVLESEGGNVPPFVFGHPNPNFEPKKGYPHPTKFRDVESYNAAVAKIDNQAEGEGSTGRKGSQGGFLSNVDPKVKDFAKKAGKMGLKVAGAAVVGVAAYHGLDAVVQHIASTPHDYAINLSKDVVDKLSDCVVGMQKHHHYDPEKLKHLSDAVGLSVERLQDIGSNPANNHSNLTPDDLKNMAQQGGIAGKTQLQSLMNIKDALALGVMSLAGAAGVGVAYQTMIGSQLKESNLINEAKYASEFNEQLADVLEFLKSQIAAKVDKKPTPEQSSQFNKLAEVLSLKSNDSWTILDWGKAIQEAVKKSKMSPEEILKATASLAEGCDVFYRSQIPVTEGIRTSLLVIEEDLIQKEEIQNENSGIQETSLMSLMQLKKALLLKDESSFEGVQESLLEIADSDFESLMEWIGAKQYRKNLSHFWGVSDTFAQKRHQVKALKQRHIQWLKSQKLYKEYMDTLSLRKLEALVSSAQKQKEKPPTKAQSNLRKVGKFLDQFA